MRPIFDYKKKIASGMVCLLFCFLCACGAFSLDGYSEEGATPFVPTQTAEQEAVAEIPTLQESTEPTSTEADGSVAKAAGEGFYFETLSDTEKLWYQDMYLVMSAMSKDGELNQSGIEEIGEEGIEKIFQCVMNDHPDLFYVKGYTYTEYTYGEETEKITFSGTYTMDAAQREERQQQIDAAVEQWLLGISGAASQYEKVKYVYESVILRTEYNQQAAENQNIYSVFLGGQSVCQGYAKAVQYLLERMGVPATLVIGTVSNGESHAWNLVWVDGESYYLDATWGDASYQVTEDSGISRDSLPEISYDYLCITTEQLLKTHTPGGQWALPKCNSLAANYYVREGAYFTTYDEAALADFFDRGYDEGKITVTFKCGDEPVYRQYVEELINNQKIFDFMNSPDGKVAYTEDADKYLLTFWLVNE